MHATSPQKSGDGATRNKKFNVGSPDLNVLSFDVLVPDVLSSEYLNLAPRVRGVGGVHALAPLAAATH